MHRLATAVSELRLFMTLRLAMEDLHEIRIVGNKTL